MEPVGLHPEAERKTIVASVIYLTCSLSIIGSLLIIITYILFRDLRTNVRLILLHLSIMDLGIGLANLIGTAINFNKYYTAHRRSNFDLMDGVCRTQAVFAAYSTYGSILWTNCLAVYLYFAVVHRISKKAAACLMSFMSLFCYLLPVLLTCWLIVTHKLGPSPYGSGGWCAIVDVDPITGVRNNFTVSFGYDMWIYLTFILVPILYIGTRFHINLKVLINSNFVLQPCIINYQCKYN